MSKRSVKMIALTKDDIQRFETNAPAALQRRGGNFIAREFGRGLEQMFIGVWPLFGAWYLGWSAVEMTIFFLARMWAAILCDVAKLRLLKPAIMRFVKEKYDDWHVWTVAQALRDKQTKVVESHLRAQYEPWLGVGVDFTFGVVGTAMIWFSLLYEVDRPITDYFERQSLLVSLSLAVAYQVAMTLWEISSNVLRSDSDVQVQVASGARGIGLFLLMFVAVIAQESIKDSEQLAGWIMSVVNGTIFFAGLLNILGYWIVKSETKWLAGYLRDRNRSGVE